MMTALSDTDHGAADRLLRRAQVWDLVTPIHAELGNGVFLLERFARSGYAFASLTIAGDDYDAGQALKRLAHARAEVTAQSDRYVLAERVEDVDRARREGKLAVGLHFEGTRCFDRELTLIEAFYTLGVRHTLLAFNRNNDCGGGCGDLDDPGLTRFGRRVVEEMNRVGMVVDLSHTGRRTSLEACALSAKPVIFSHSNAYALHPHYRNVDDAQIDACAKTGGVIGISGFSAYLGEERAGAAAMARHIDYIAQRVGAAHVGLGADFIAGADSLRTYVAQRGPEEWPIVNGIGYESMAFTPPEAILALVETLLAMKYTDADILDILGLNWRRVMQACWR